MIRCGFIVGLISISAWATQATAQIIGGGQAGVVVDAEGVLQMKVYSDPSGQLTAQRMGAAKAALDPKLTAYSKCRKISLNRLEEAVRQRDGVATEEMRSLAGMLRIQYVFYYPETRDIVLAGPAEGWMTDVAGRVVGLTTRRPVLQLQDLVVALRAFPPGKQPTRLIGCSIDPTEEGLAAMQQFLRTWGRGAVPGQTHQIVEGLQTSLGAHTVSINGIAPDTRFAQVLVEADYRMKLIGIGLEQPPIKMVSYVDRASPSQVSRSALERWFFVPDYECVRVSEDKLAAELVGDGVKLVGEGEAITHDGQRQAGRASNKASQAFTYEFTKRYADLAEKSPVFAELRNLIDMTVAAAFIQQQDYYGKASWAMDLFGRESAFKVQTYHTPKRAPAAINAIWRGQTLMTPIGGGVTIDATQAVSTENVLADEKGTVSQTYTATKPNPTPGQWWWD
jgi:hypothetical protein